jgi:hypothetical protein
MRAFTQSRIKTARIPDNGTVCKYVVSSDKKELRIELHGRPDMPKLKREEHETSDDEADVQEDEHTLLGSIECGLHPEEHTCVLFHSQAMEKEKGYGKLLYLKLALWCKKNHFKYIDGRVVNEKAMPLLLRYNLPGTRTVISIDNHNDLAKEEALEDMGIKLKEVGKHLVVQNTKLTHEQMIALIPCDAITEIL